MRVNGRVERSHRISWVLHSGSAVPDETNVCHRCDNPSCVNPDHLFLGTQLDNMSDCKAKGRLADTHRENNPNHRVTEQQVREIRARYASSKTPGRQLAREFGIHFSTIYRILRREIWKLRATAFGAPVEDADEPIPGVTPV